MIRPDTPEARVAHAPAIDALMSRVRSEYTELPGLQLTPWQAQRLWALDQAQCDAVLEALVEAAFLRRTRQGSYVRAADSY